MDMGEAMPHEASRVVPADSAPPADPMWTYALAGTMAAAVVGSSFGLRLGVTDWLSVVRCGGCILFMGLADVGALFGYLSAAAVICGLLAGLAPGLGLALWSRRRPATAIPEWLGWWVVLAAGYAWVLPAVVHGLAARVPELVQEVAHRDSASFSFGVAVPEILRWLTLGLVWPAILFGLVTAYPAAWLHSVLVRRPQRRSLVTHVLAGGMAVATIGAIVAVYVDIWYQRRQFADCAPPIVTALYLFPTGAVDGVFHGMVAGLLCGLLGRCWKRAWGGILWLASYLVVAGWPQIRLSPERSVVFAFLELDHWSVDHPHAGIVLTIAGGLLCSVLGPAMMRLLDGVAYRGPAV